MEKSPGDLKLWNAFRLGSEEAFVRIFHQYSDPLFHYGCTITNDRELIKDSIQELLCDLWDRGENCPEVANLKAFLFTGLRRIILRKLQRRRRYLLREEPDGQADTLSDPDSLNRTVEADIIRRETLDASGKKLKLAVRKLPPRQREAIHLRYFQGLSYEEMAAVMEVKKGTIGRFIAQAVDNLRKAMDKIMLLLILLLGLLYI